MQTFKITKANQREYWKLQEFYGKDAVKVHRHDGLQRREPITHTKADELINVGQAVYITLP